MSVSPRLLIDRDFWQLPREERMAAMNALREADRFHAVEFEHPDTGETETFHAVLRYEDVIEVSKRPEDFCSGRGAVSLADMPEDLLAYFGSFINMDGERHDRQRTIVSRSFTPKRLDTIIDSVEQITTEVIDAFCEKGEVDLVEALSQPLPLMVICDMMGIPRSEFSTVLDATNVILGSGDPDYVGDRDPREAAAMAGIQLIQLMNELAEERRLKPTDDLTSQLVHTDVGEELLAPGEVGPFFILLAVAGNDTTRNAISHGIDLLSQNPEQRRLLQDDLPGMTKPAVEEILRMASPVTFMRRTVTRDLMLGGRNFRTGDKLVMFYGAANRDPRAFSDPDTFDIRRSPNHHVAFGGPGPHFCLGANLARRELGVVLRHLLTRLPDLDLAGAPVPLDPAAMVPPLVAGLKRLPVRFTSASRAGV